MDSLLYCTAIMRSVRIVENRLKSREPTTSRPYAAQPQTIAILEPSPSPKKTIVILSTCGCSFHQPKRNRVPHPRRAFVFAARVGNHKSQPVVALAFALAFLVCHSLRESASLFEARSLRTQEDRRSAPYQPGATPQESKSNPPKDRRSAPSSAKFAIVSPKLLYIVQFAEGISA